MSFKLDRKKKDTSGINTVVSSDSETLINYTSTFDFEEFGIIEKDEIGYFIEQEKKILHFGNQFNKVIYDIGKLLVEVKEKFKKHNERGFQAWYENLGIHKDLVSVATKRYNLYLENPQKKEVVYSMSTAVLKQVTNKKTPEEVKEKVLKGELKTAKEVTEAKKQFSPVGENKKSNEGIEEAEIIDCSAVPNTESKNVEQLDYPAVPEYVEKKYIKGFSKAEIKEEFNVFSLLKLMMEDGYMKQSEIDRFGNIMKAAISLQIDIMERRSK